ncbi:MAG: STAS domain-containing protein [Clostridia bacterium]|nr:STAS domain-containing protein [Clostridia bacterium]
MEILKNKTGSNLVIYLSGRLDTVSAPQLEEELKASIGDVTELILDISNLEYMSSAGLRILLSAQKTMNAKGKMIVKNVNDTIMEIFEVTGFIDILTIEN